MRNYLGLRGGEIIFILDLIKCYYRYAVLLDIRRDYNLL